MKRNKFYWIIQVLNWSFVAFTTLKYSNNDLGTDLWAKVVYAILYLVFGFGVSHFYHRLQEKTDPDQITPRQFTTTPLLWSVLIGSLFFVVDNIFFNYQLLRTGRADWFDFCYLWLEDIWLVLPWFLFYHLYRFVKIYEERRQRIIQTEKTLKAVELESLKQQLNPHFLFNALNSIKSLTISDSRQAREAITQLSDLLRLSLNLGEQNKASLGDELQLAQDYLALEKVRFDKRLNYRFDIQAGVESIQILPMSLNTLVENAVKHGIGKLRNGGDIVIKAYTVGNLLVLQVENSGTYTPNPKSSTSGIGLENLRKRLDLHYGDAATLNITNQHNTVISEVIMPF